MRLESALKIVGALKHRFGEALSVSDICRAVPLSYQPVYDYVQRLTVAGVVRTVKSGRRVLCEPAATPAAAVWLAHWSLDEAKQQESPAITELMADLESRITADVAAGAGIIAIDPDGGDGAVVHTTERGLDGAVWDARIHLMSRAQLGDVLSAPDGTFGVARRILPILGHQLLWSVALSARDKASDEPKARPRPRSARRPAFID